MFNDELTSDDRQRKFAEIYLRFSSGFDPHPFRRSARPRQAAENAAATTSGGFTLSGSSPGKASARIRVRSRRDRRYGRGPGRYIRSRRHRPRAGFPAPPWRSRRRPRMRAARRRPTRSRRRRRRVPLRSSGSNAAISAWLASRLRLSSRAIFLGSMSCTGDSEPSIAALRTRMSSAPSVRPRRRPACRCFRRR